MPAQRGPPKPKLSWWRTYIDLIEDGFVARLGTRSERGQARAMTCCGGGMELKAFELIGDEGELVAYRTFAVCPQCRRWCEF